MPHTHPDRTGQAACRPLDHLAAVGWLYPEAWRLVGRVRSSKGKCGLPDWPDWCFLPMVAFYAIVGKEANVDRLPPHLVPDVARLAALCTWRHTQGVYRFGPDVRDAVVSAGVDEGTDCGRLHTLPDWCVYIETPGQEWGGMPLHGFFAHMEWDTGDETASLRLLLDHETGLCPCPVRLGADALDRALSQTGDAALIQPMGNGQLVGIPPVVAGADSPGDLEPLVSLVLFLCGSDAEISGSNRQPPGGPTPMPGHPYESGPSDAHPAEALISVRHWQVGTRNGSAKRQAQGLSDGEKGRRRGVENNPPKRARRADQATL